MRAGHLLTLMVLSVSAVGCSPERASGVRVQAGAPVLQAVGVRAAVAGVGTLRATRSASGTVVAGRDVQVAAETSGRVVTVSRLAGETVKAGEVVVRLDDAAARDALRDAELAVQSARITLQSSRRAAPGTLVGAGARMAAADTTLANAERSLAANSELYAAGGLSRVDLEASRAAVSSARAERQATLRELQTAERAPSEGIALQEVGLAQAENRVSQLRRDLARTAVRAPFAGRLAEVGARVGAYLNAGSPAFRLLDSASVRVDFQVSPADAARLASGTALSVVVGGQSFAGRVSRNAAATGQSRLVELSARFVGAATVPVGAAAVVRYQTTLARGTLVPSGAVQTEGGENFVYVLSAGRAVRTAVTVLGESGGQVAARGVASGARVITPVPAGLQPGAAVRLVGGGS
ncbi:efflux RND transporter periplasmic adaptor subunit [Deinococcus koreensis]|uniref:Efflux transporter periplasmic adaptor subunit n=1 Tax=Deinococcus koreensis TaxID=2054903 RepID=A0A2K3UT54_9DEIO|nr:HlyD family efflux transporter periplasmic adaptor subunit [Deinococcus koreensis]PNY79716.1 efflux transporter periplasmic adaptor subunit [Deinococcus koreensis]